MRTLCICGSRHEDSVYLYGVFDGHDGSRVSDFSAQRMPAELLLGQLVGCQTDSDVKDVLRQVLSVTVIA